MSSKGGVKFRVGDLVVYSKGYRNGKSYNIWCRVLEMDVIGFGLKSEVRIVTGWGDLNTRVKFKLGVLGWSIGYSWDLTNEIMTENDAYQVGEILTTEETHSVHLVEWDYFQEKYEDMMRIIHHKMDFVRKNRNPIEVRDEKLNQLGI
jgi:hypothetical protein